MPYTLNKAFAYCKPALILPSCQIAGQNHCWGEHFVTETDLSVHRENHDPFPEPFPASEIY